MFSLVLHSFVVDPWHFGTDPDPRTHAPGQWIRLRIRIRIQEDQKRTDPDPQHRLCCWVIGPLVSVSDPACIRINRVNGSGKKLGNFMFRSAGCSLLRAEGYTCGLDVLYGDQIFLNFTSSKPWIRNQWIQFRNTEALSTMRYVGWREYWQRSTREYWMIYRGSGNISGGSVR